MEGRERANNLDAHFNPEFRPELGVLLERAGDNRHLSFLVDRLASGATSVRDFIDYGIQNLPEEESRPDMQLAEFLLVVSELKGLQKEVQDLAVDLMVYSETEVDFPGESRAQLLERYRKVAPHLAQKGRRRP